MIENSKLINTIYNPNQNSLISSCIIYIEDLGAGKKRKIIQIKRNNEYELIFEKELLTTYTKNRKNEVIANEFEKINCCTNINANEIECILSFIWNNQTALDIFNEYLKHITKQNNIDNTQMNNEIDFEPLDETIYDVFNGTIQAISFKATELNGLYEKYISIKQDENWKNIYYGSFNKNEIILEMTIGLSYLEIEQIRNILSIKPKLLNEFDKCIKIENKQNQLIKKY